jgi:hypothetical protein
MAAAAVAAPTALCQRSLNDYDTGNSDDGEAAASQKLVRSFPSLLRLSVRRSPQKLG